MQKYREILRKLVKLFGKASQFPARIGPEDSTLIGVDKEKTYRISGQRGEPFPATDVQEKLGCSENELIAALEWVTQKESSVFHVEEGMFWAFVPKLETDWPQV